MRTPIPSVLKRANLAGGLHWIAQIEVLRVVARGWRYLAVGSLITVTLAGLYVAGTKRMYQATARLLVLQEGGPPLSTVESGHLLGGDDYLPTHAAILKSPLVVGHAIELAGAANLPTLNEVHARTGKGLVAAAIEELTISRPDRTAKIVCIDYRAGSRDEATRFVAALVDSYRGFLEDKFQKTNGDVVSLITSARDKLLKELEEMQVRYLEFRRTHLTSTTDEAGRSFLSRRLDQWDRAANEAMIKEVQLRAQLELGRKLAKQGLGFWAVVHAMNQIGGGDPALLAHATEPSMGGPTDFVRQLGREQQEMAERFGPHYTKVRDLEEQIQRVQERARESRGRIDRAEVGELLSSIEKGLEAVQALRAEMSRRFDEDLTLAKKSEDDQLVEANLKGNMQLQQNLFNTTVEQLKRAQLVGDYNAINAQVIEEPNALPGAVQPRVGMTLALALLLGIVSGGATAFLADRLDVTFRSPEDLREAFDLPVLGRVPELADAGAIDGPLGLISRISPFSPQAEAYRVIRTHLELMRRQSPVRCLLVTSPHLGDGKSTTASNLAIGLAHAGRRVLLVDADLRRPSQDAIHGLPRDRGLAQVLLGSLPIQRAIRQGAVANLDVVVAGSVVPNPAELLMSDRLQESLAAVRGSYDVVIIDSSPLLAVADAAILASAVDGVLLVARPSTLRRREAERVNELLRGLATPVLGLIVNRVAPDRSGYFYDQGMSYGDASEGSADDEIVAAGTSLSGHATNGHLGMNGRDDGPADLIA